MHALLFICSIMYSVVNTFKQQPIYAFFLYQIVYFFNPNYRWWSYQIPDFKYAFSSSTFLLLVCLFSKNYRERSGNLFKSTPLVLLTLFSATFSATYFFAYFQVFHIMAVEDLIKSLIVIFCAYKLCINRESISIIKNGYAIGATYLAFYTYQIGRNAGDRVEGVGTVDAPDANDTAAMLCPALFFAAHNFYTAKSLKSKAAWLVSCGLIANALILINSRGAFLAIIIGALILAKNLLIIKVDIFKHKRKLFAIAFVAIIGLFSVLDKAALERFSSITQEAKTEDRSKESGSTRIEFWKAAINMSLDYPMGLGTLGFNGLSSRYIPESVDTGGNRSKTVHSTWFEVLTEAGYLGACFYLSLCFYIYRKLISIRKYVNKVRDEAAYLSISFLHSAIISWFVCITFINRMRAEVFIWLVLIAACTFFVYKVEKNAVVANKTEAA